MNVNSNEIKTKSDLLNNITKIAIEYAPKCKDSVLRNRHMNGLLNDDTNSNVIIQDGIDAILVDFVNYIGMHQGLDWGLYTKDLHEEK